MKLDMNSVIEENKELYYKDATFHYICSCFITSVEIPDMLVMNTIIILCEKNRQILDKLEEYINRYGNIELKEQQNEKD